MSRPLRVGSETRSAAVSGAAAVSEGPGAFRALALPKGSGGSWQVDRWVPKGDAVSHRVLLKEDRWFVK